MPTTDTESSDRGGDAEPSDNGLEILTPRDVPLGGVRDMTVRRTLPQRRRSLIGPWCFLDHFGPDDVAATGGMVMPRHPHTGLATVTLLFSGNVEHLDSTGFGNTIKPGEVNLMIAGHGVSHSEFSTAETTTLHGVQLWYALPDALRDGPAQAQHHAAQPVEVPGGSVLTYLGDMAGASSPVDTRTPACAAEVLVEAAAFVDLELDPQYEHGILLDSGRVGVSVRGSSGADGDLDAELPPGALLHLPPGCRSVRLQAGHGSPARVIVIGGPPFEEEIVMWWNFVGRNHAEIVQYRSEWQREIGVEPAPEPAPPRFGPYPAGSGAALPAPTLPLTEIHPRTQPRGPLR
ncbi:pirin family protein [Brachybacterium sp. FME24]|uniref:pirin family protein n=1 Tax=Brachybacterium sp. FME24 TaxID=2742605 RepID=UPI00186695BE|nr:pirin family protein [Brachybacterium sp. FME24]